MKKTGGFLKTNWAYLIWFSIYFSIAICTFGLFVDNVWLCILYSFLLYGATIGLALSPVGEIVLRVLEGIKPIQTERDREYLEPIFDEVYSEALKHTPELNKDIQLYISESMTVNAFAIGRKTIAVTRGAMQVFSPEELKGVLSHEFGHMANGDTKALLISVIGNGFFSIIIFVLKIFVNLFQNISLALSGKNLIISIFAFMSVIAGLVLDFSVFVFVFIGDVVIALNSRYSEFLADEYAHLIGYGDELKNSLYMLNKLSMPKKATITEILKASHPHTTARIERLEKMINESV